MTSVTIRLSNITVIRAEISHTHAVGASLDRQHVRSTLSIWTYYIPCNGLQLVQRVRSQCLTWHHDMSCQHITCTPSLTISLRRHTGGTRGGMRRRVAHSWVCLGVWESAGISSVTNTKRMGLPSSPWSQPACTYALTSEHTRCGHSVAQWQRTVIADAQVHGAGDVVRACAARSAPSEARRRECHPCVTCGQRHAHGETTQVGNRCEQCGAARYGQWNLPYHKVGARAV